MTFPPFEEYATYPDRSPDEIYTIELLIEKVRQKVDPDYWEESMAREDAREAPDYRPSFEACYLTQSKVVLERLEWLSFQRLGSKKRSVKNITPLRYLKSITTLVLIGNEVEDLSPLVHCRHLQELNLGRSHLTTLAPLSQCLKIERLELQETPVDGFEVLESLPILQKLSLSGAYKEAFFGVHALPALKSLEVGSEEFDSFSRFPDMPELLEIRGASVNSLEGLQRYPKLQSLINISGGISSLDPIRALRSLTHLNLTRTKVESLEPLSRLFALRSLWLGIEKPRIDLTPLEGLPALHEVTIKSDLMEVAGLEKLRDQLVSWDVEFFSPVPRHAPSLQLEVVDQRAFDHFDTAQKFNVTDADSNYSLLRSEMEWIEAKLHEAFAPDFINDEHYSIPYRWGGARSRTVTLLHDEAAEAFARIVLAIQKVLASARHDWIIYFQSDIDVDIAMDFVVWVYPNKIMVSECHAAAVRKLLTPR